MTADDHMREELHTRRPPGAARLVQDAELIRGRDTSKQMWQQSQRVHWTVRT